MFIKMQCQPSIEFSPGERHQAPILVHYFSDRCDPFKMVLPQFVEAASGDQEHVLVVESPLSGIVDDTIWLHRRQDASGGVVIDERQRAFFDAVKLSLVEAIAKIEQIEFVTVDGDEDGRAEVMV